MEPLAQHKLFETSDFDEAREHIARVFCPHRLNPRGQRLTPTRQHRVDLGGASLNYISYGGRVEIVPGCLDRFFLLQIPLAGHALIRSGGQEVAASPHCATLLSPTLDTAMDWSADCRKLLLQVDRARIERALEAMLGRPIGRPVEFDVAFPITGSLERVVRLLRTLQEDLDDGGGLLVNGLAGAKMSEALVMTLLGTQRHTYTDALAAPAAPIAPRHVRRAEEFMRANLAASLTLEHIAREAGASTRALQEGFRRFRGTTPLESLRAMRMAAARRDLLAGRAGDGVTGVALRWGFTHLGRFAASYRHHFGESPSKTLQRGGVAAPPRA